MPRTANASVAIGQRLRERRHDIGLTVERLALKSKVSIRTIINVEHGKSSPSYDVVDRLAVALGTTVADIAAQVPAKKAS